MQQGSSKDAFICHSSGDKVEVVRPLASLLAAAGVSCWVDEAEIRWGDSITEKVNEGLQHSRYVIVILSQAFADGHWPNRELNSALNVEASSGRVRVLPLVTGSRQVRAQLRETYPLLNDKRYMCWPDDQEDLVDDIRHLLGGTKVEASTHRQQATPQRRSGRDIPVPRVRREPTELERHTFVSETLATTRDYFDEALPALKQQNDHVAFSLQQIHPFKFVCRVYVQGQTVCSVKIWANDDHIYYSQSSRSIDDDNSYNDSLNVKRDRLAWETSGFSMRGEKQSDLSAEGAAEYLWQRVVSEIESRS